MLSLPTERLFPLCGNYLFVVSLQHKFPNARYHTQLSLKILQSLDESYTLCQEDGWGSYDCSPCYRREIDMMDMCTDLRIPWWRMSWSQTISGRICRTASWCWHHRIPRPCSQVWCRIPPISQKDLVKTLHFHIFLHSLHYRWILLSAHAYKP